MTKISPLVASAAVGGDAFELINPDSISDLLFVCDHASNRVPSSVSGNNLGLSNADITRHIAYDVGAHGLTVRLAAHFGATAVLSRFSRLVVDPNRGEDDPTLVMRLYDGSIVAGNRGVDETEIARRLMLFHRPYHLAVTRQLDRIIASGKVPKLVSIHSYTPQLKGRAPRPWHIGVLWDRDNRLAGPLLSALRRDRELCIGDNEPYTGRLQGDSMYNHGTLRGIPHALIELRNDLIGTAEGEANWAERLVAPLTSAIGAIE